MRLFIPPRCRPLAMLVARLALPLHLRFTDRIVKVEIDGESLERLRALRGGRVILTPNHSYIADSVVIFHLARRLGQHWNFLSALENFLVPVQGWLLRNIGVYSVIRGTMDRRSYRCTQQLLQAGERWLVIFPEGEIVGQNDVIGKFQPGTVHMSCWALREMCAAQPHRPLPPIYIVPVAIKYLLAGDVRPAIRRCMVRLERKLGLAEGPQDLYDRLAQIGEAVLTTTEREYGLPSTADALFDDRVQAVKGAILDRVAREVGVMLHPDSTRVEQVRALFLAVDRVMWAPIRGTPYARQLRQEHRRRVVALYADLWRVLRFAAAFDGYVRETMTWERMVELLNRLEWEVLGVQRMIGPQIAVLRVGTPVNLTPHYQAYRADWQATVNSLTRAQEQAVGSLLAELNRRATPLDLPPRLSPV